MCPSYEDAKYTPTDSDESSGLVDGISYKELMKKKIAGALRPGLYYY